MHTFTGDLFFFKLSPTDADPSPRNPFGFRFLGLGDDGGRRTLHYTNTVFSGGQLIMYGLFGINFNEEGDCCDLDKYTGEHVAGCGGGNVGEPEEVCPRLEQH